MLIGEPILPVNSGNGVSVVGLEPQNCSGRILGDRKNYTWNQVWEL